jgi:site-specific DNA-methyltransferase (adenine-specific)
MFICSDNLTYIKTLDTSSIDLIYFDPPFNITEADYDNKLDWDNLWSEMWRVLKPRANIVIHSSQPFTYDLIASQRKKFKYCWYWNKTYKTGHLFSKHQPMRHIEEICVFYKKGIYNPQTTLKNKPKTVTNTSGNYFGRNQDKTYTNNLNYPSHLLNYYRRNHKYSTRPVELCEYIIKTYSKKNDLVLDLTCSDGQSAIACRNLNRKYIGVDISPQMIEDAEKNYLV